MIRKAPSLLFILVANFVLLAHSIIPHLHDDGFASLLSHRDDYHCNYEGNHFTGAHNEKNSNKNHDENEGASDCNLKLTFFSPSTKIEFRYFENSKERISDSALLLNYCRLSTSVLNFFSLNLLPTLNSLFPVYLPQCFGLRAPPLA